MRLTALSAAIFLACLASSAPLAGVKRGAVTNGDAPLTADVPINDYKKIKADEKAASGNLYVLGYGYKKVESRDADEDEEVAIDAYVSQPPYGFKKVETRDIEEDEELVANFYVKNEYKKIDSRDAEAEEQLNAGNRYVNSYGYKKIDAKDIRVRDADANPQSEGQYVSDYRKVNGRDVESVEDTASLYVVDYRKLDSRDAAPVADGPPGRYINYALQDRSGGDVE